MSGTTARFGFPYPTAADTVASVATTVQALANALEAAIGLRASSVLDFPNIAAGGIANLTIACVGAVVGNDVNVSFNPAGLASGIVLQAGVTAADVVTVRAQNCTNAAIDPAAITVRVCVWPH